VGAGLGTTVGHSLQADVIDDDEWSTGERKEGTYFAVWNFVRKGAVGFTAFLTGAALQWVGFEPNVAQSADVVLLIRVMFGLLPGVMFVVGIALFARFTLSEERHREIQRELAEREAG